MRHRFEWMHVEPRCDPRCDHYEHWETRCVECGERECVLSRDQPCVHSMLQVAVATGRIASYRVEVSRDRKSVRVMIRPTAYLDCVECEIGFVEHKP